MALPNLSCNIRRRYRKTDTDKFDFSYLVNDEGTFLKSVWETKSDVGPGCYNIGHVDRILNNHRNDVRSIIALDYGTDVCREKLYEDKVKFKP